MTSAKPLRMAVHSAMLRQLLLYSTSSRSRMLSSETLSSVSRFCLFANSIRPASLEPRGERDEGRLSASEALPNLSVRLQCRNLAAALLPNL